MQNKEQENTEVFAEQEKARQKKKKLKIVKSHIQGFVAGVLVSVIVFTGFLTGLKPRVLSGAMWNPEDILCDISYGNITVERAGYDISRITYYESEGSELSELVYSPSKIIIKGSTDKYRIKVSDNADVDMVLNGVIISSLSPVRLGIYSNVRMILENKNELRGGSVSPAISVDIAGSLEISGTGSLTAIGGDNAPGIGSIDEYFGYSGVINIYGGTINATGGKYGAGIGGRGSQKEFGQINIYGGTVTATGGVGANGLGRGGLAEKPAECSSINITGGTVVATGGKDAEGIYNSNNNSYGNNVTVIDGPLP